MTKTGWPWDSKPDLPLTPTLALQKSTLLPNIMRTFNKYGLNGRPGFSQGMNENVSQSYLDLKGQKTQILEDRQTRKPCLDGMKSLTVAIQWFSIKTRLQDEVCLNSRSMLFLLIPTVPSLKGPGLVPEPWPKLVQFPYPLSAYFALYYLKYARSCLRSRPPWT